MGLPFLGAEEGRDPYTHAIKARKAHVLLLIIFALHISVGWVVITSAAVCCIYCGHLHVWFVMLDIFMVCPSIAEVGPGKIAQEICTCTLFCTSLNRTTLNRAKDRIKTGAVERIC